MRLSWVTSRMVQPCSLASALGGRHRPARRSGPLGGRPRLGLLPFILDLGIELLEEKKEEPKKEEEKPAPVPTGEVTVTMDTLTLPGSLVSGKVTFSDGETGIWMFDQNGRLGFDPDTPGYRPSQDDSTEFQIQLRALIQKSGL